MSGIFGIFNRNAKAVKNESIEILQQAMSYWKPDEENVWVDGPVALGHGMLWNTPESKYEHLPLKEDAYVLTMDARIDNRDELTQVIELPDKPLSQIGDSEFILGAYKKWGEDCPKHLLGDFAFVIWDEQKQQLFCARDHVGVKQLYYHVSDDLFLCGNDLKVLTQYPNISQEINDEAVANYIVNYELISNHLTFFKEMSKLPPAHSIVITATKVKKRCYWRLEDAPKIKLPNAEAYAKKLRELLERSVYDRIRSDYTITSHLSGGLDSSSIAVIAARKLHEKGKKLFAYNWVPEPSEKDDPTYYEWANSKAVADAEGIEHSYVALTAKDIFHYMNKQAVVYGNSVKFWYEYLVRNAVQENESRTILSGWGGDELITYHGQAYYSDLVQQGKVWKSIKELKAKISKKNKGIKPIVGALYYKLFLPLLPRFFYCRMPKTVCENKLYVFVNKSFLPMVEKEINNSSGLTGQLPLSIRKHMLAFWQNNHIQSRIDSWSTAAIENRLEYNYPLLDKRIIEFALGVPAEYFVSNGTGRYLFRKSIKGILPEKIVWTDAKEEHNRVKRLLSLFLSSSKLFLELEKERKSQSKYIDRKKLFETIESFKLSAMDMEKVFLVLDIETAMLLILSDELTQKNSIMNVCL